LVPLCGCDK
jgi:triosephosphate isomerase